MQKLWRRDRNRRRLSNPAGDPHRWQPPFQSHESHSPSPSTLTRVNASRTASPVQHMSISQAIAGKKRREATISTQLQSRRASTLLGNTQLTGAFGQSSPSQRTPPQSTPVEEVSDRPFSPTQMLSQAVRTNDKLNQSTIPHPLTWKDNTARAQDFTNLVQYSDVLRDEVLRLRREQLQSEQKLSQAESAVKTARDVMAELDSAIKHACSSFEDMVNCSICFEAALDANRCEYCARCRKRICSTCMDGLRKMPKPHCPMCRNDGVLFIKVPKDQCFNPQDVVDLHASLAKLSSVVDAARVDFSYVSRAPNG